ncbi:Maf-like protein YhdE [Posidoniimonas polymericola]|uniref:dTTP/UTP pyrophosphatase n=1 Tax=Posidoniimonas polymericola TaxID=2528002 RepID=A0A5C5YM06_9BACT|nr:Maf family protein [Posidoniimonas polymericola]TWT75870.1 Maf-like protein YhdE [Posidoniimonas polymericola]
MTRLILASGSPRRSQLLSDAGYRFEVIPPHDSAEADAPRLPDPTSLVCDLARRKAEDVVKRLAGEPQPSWVLAADTIAECGGQVLGKPDDAADARRILEALSGTRHSVLTGVCLWRSDQPAPAECWHAESQLEMDRLGDRWLEDYLASGAWEGKAGAFGYQDGLVFVRIVAGSESNVVGLPLDEVRAMFQRVGWNGLRDES